MTRSRSIDQQVVPRRLRITVALAKQLADRSPDEIVLLREHQLDQSRKEQQEVSQRRRSVSPSSLTRCAGATTCAHRNPYLRYR